jgi:hypothetical protein
MTSPPTARKRPRRPDRVSRAPPAKAGTGGGAISTRPLFTTDCKGVDHEPHSNCHPYAPPSPRANACIATGAQLAHVGTSRNMIGPIRKTTFPTN